MDNSKYLELVDLVGHKMSESIAEKASELLADFEHTEQCRKQAIEMMSVPRRTFSGLSEHVTTGHRLLDSAHPDINWRGMPLLCHDLDCLEDEWTCQYCGKVNPASARACGEGVWDGCGAPLPREDEPPHEVQELEQFGSFYVVKETDHPLPEMRFYSEPSMTVTHPGQTAREYKQAIGARVASALRKAISQWA